MSFARRRLPPSSGRLFGALAVALATSPACAADLLRGPLADAPAPASYDWSGFHVGIEGGYGRGYKQNMHLTGAHPGEQALVDAGGIGTVTFARSGGVYGGGVGYTYQLAPGSGPVFGIEATVLGTDIHRTRATAFNFAGNSFAVGAEQGLDWLGLVRGRVGYAFDRVLVYGTGGLAFGHVAFSGHTDLTAPMQVPIDAGRYRGTQSGYVYGGGIEVAMPALPILAQLGGDVSLKLEYLRYELGARDVVIAGTGPVYGPGGPLAAGQTGTARVDTGGHLLTAGLRYRFSTFGR